MVKTQTDSEIKDLLYKNFDLSKIGTLLPSPDVPITIDNGKIYVKGNVTIKTHLVLKKLPIKFGTVDGFFSVHSNKLTSCIGFPSQVGDYCDLNNNNLISLDHCTQYVNTNFTCSNNMLTSLENGPTFVGVNYDVGGNFLTSLVGSPEIINGSYDAGYNTLLHTLDGLPKGTFNDSVYLSVHKNLPILRLLSIDKSVALRFDTVDSDKIDFSLIKLIKILDQYRGKTPRKQAMLDCQNALINAGFAGLASW